MESLITPLEWENYIDKLNIVSIDSDYMLFRSQSSLPVPQYPFKVNMTSAIFCLRGQMNGYIDMKYYEMKAPCIAIVSKQQILQQESVSDDFDGLFIVMSSRFLNNLFNRMQEIIPLELSVKERPVVPLNQEELEIMETCYEMIYTIIQQKDNPNRLEIVKHLTLAFFYHTGAQIHKVADMEKKTKQDLLLDKFLRTVHEHFKKERSVNFYADKLCLTPKHLTTVIRQSTGKTALNWIDQYVMLEAKALLKSSKLTIQQISDELNFPSQSFFGKYFKRHEGVSPSEYKRQ